MKESIREEIDRALVRFGFAVGPLKLLDEVEIETGQKIARVLHEAFGERMAPAPALGKVLQDGRLGRKNRRGFYVYGKAGSPSKRSGRKVDATVYDLLGVHPSVRLKPDEIAMRCVSTMVNEAFRCLGEGILRSAREGDVGAVMGLGFPPFRGGPFRHLEALGAPTLLAQLEEYRRRYGARFAPAPALQELASGQQRDKSLSG